MILRRIIRFKIETSQCEELVVFKDWEKLFCEWTKKGKTEANILANGTDWHNPDFLKNLTDEEWDLLNDNKPSAIKNETIQKISQSKTNKKIEYKTTSIHRIKINLDKIEISIKTTSEIPKEIQNELIALIDKWKNL